MGRGLLIVWIEQQDQSGSDLDDQRYSVNMVTRSNERGTHLPTRVTREFFTAPVILLKRIGEGFCGLGRRSLGSSIKCSMVERPVVGISPMTRGVVII